MGKCANCDHKLRVGSIRWGHVAGDDGKIVSALVCTKCAHQAIKICIPPPTTVAPLCSQCKRGLACVCESCARALATNVRELASANVALALLKKPLQSP